VKIEKRLIVYSIVALMIGVASIVPLTFLMSAKAETPSKPWFNIDVPYAYLTANVTENLDGRAFYGLWHTILLNLTLNPEAANEIADARFEYFELQIYTDKEPVFNASYFAGTNRTNAFTFDIQSFHFMRDDWFDSNTTGGGMFTYNWDANVSVGMSGISGSNHGSTSAENFKTPQEVAALREAEVVYIDVRRIGLVTFNGNSTVITLSDNEVIQHIELQKFGYGFLYNTMFPEDQLSQTDPINPLKSLGQQET